MDLARVSHFLYCTYVYVRTYVLSRPAYVLMPRTGLSTRLGHGVTQKHVHSSVRSSFGARHRLSAKPYVQTGNVMMP